MTSLRVRHPERWWLATRRDLPWLTDPDVDDGRQRWTDRNELDWAAVGEAVVSIGFRLTTGSSSVDPDDPTYVIVPTPWVLPEPEATVARSWWGSEAPQGDVWSTGLVNGRHRLWNVWRVAPQAQLPVRSDTLEYLSDVPACLAWPRRSGRR